MSNGQRALHGLLDTSTLILLHELDDPSQLPEEPLISTITLAELSVGPLVTKTPEERQARQAHLQQAEADFDPLPFDEVQLKRSGRLRPRSGVRDARRRPGPTTR